MLSVQCLAGLLSAPPPDMAPRQLRQKLARVRGPIRQLDCYRQLRHVQLSVGGHHVHMTEPQAVAEAIATWLRLL